MGSHTRKKNKDSEIRVRPCTTNIYNYCKAHSRLILISIFKNVFLTWYTVYGLTNLKDGGHYHPPLVDDLIDAKLLSLERFKHMI